MGGLTEERTLTRRELNRALLARQLLLERKALSLPRALERVAGLQAQYAPSMYIGLWSRVEGFERARLTRALERRSVAQGTLMRSTIHLVSARDYWPLALAIRDARRRWWVRVHSPKARTMSAAAARVRRALASGPLRRAEIEELIGKDAARGVGLWLELVRVPPSGTWERRRADLYAAADDWLGPPVVSRAHSAAHLVRRYLGGFGPAASAEVASFAGVPQGDLAGVLERLPLRRFRSEDGEQLLDLARAPLPDPDTPAPCASSPPGTPRSSCTPAEPRSSPRSTARSSSTRGTRRRPPRSWWTAKWPGRGATMGNAFGWSRFGGSPRPPAASSRRRRSA